MKALISISFALEIESEDDLTVIARILDESMYQAIKAGLQERGPDWKENVNSLEEAGLIDWYGVAISLKRPALEGVEE